MDNRKFIGTFQSEEAVIRKIQALKAEGYKEQDIFVIAKDEDDISLLRDVQLVDELKIGWLDRFKAFLSGDEPIERILTIIGLSEAEAKRLYSEMESGSMLLYVDKEYGDLLDSGANIVRMQAGRDEEDHFDKQF